MHLFRLNVQTAYIKIHRKNSENHQTLQAR